MQRLSLRNSDIENDALVQIVEGCSQIEHLDLSLCQRLTDFAIVKMMHCLPALRSLGMEFLYISSSVLRELALTYSISLEVFHSYFYVVAHDVEFLLRHCRCLHTLSLDIGLMDFQLMNNSMFSNIRKLILSGAFWRSLSAALVLLAPHCQKLELLGLKPVNVYDPNQCTGLAAMVQHCTSLRTLVFAETYKEAQITELCALAVAAWQMLRPQLTIRYFFREFEYDKDPLEYNLFEV